MNILKASRLFTFVREGTMYEISTACFIYRSIFAVQALRKRRVQGHCAAYHFRIQYSKHYLTRLTVQVQPKLSSDSHFPEFKKESQ